MYILIEKLITGSIKTSLKTKLTPEKEVLLSLEHEDINNKEGSNYLGIPLSKNELSDFIGGLLHLQSKLNNKR